METDWKKVVDWKIEEDGECSFMDEDGKIIGSAMLDNIIEGYIHNMMLCQMHIKRFEREYLERRGE